MIDAIALDAAQRHTLRSRRSAWPVAPLGLGGLLYGAEAQPAAGGVIGGLPLPLLGTPTPVLDAWLGHGATKDGANAHGARWRHDGDWLFGAIDVPEEDAGLEAAAGHAYAGLFDALRATGITQLLRVWNYLPHINEEGNAMERYKRFNAGRQQAFLDAGERAFEGSPAACAIGSADGPLRVRFLAGRGSVRHVENPRQVSAYHYPQRYGPRAPTFSRAALAEVGRGPPGPVHLRHRQHRRPRVGAPRRPARAGARDRRQPAGGAGQRQQQEQRALVAARSARRGLCSPRARPRGGDR